MRSILIAVLTTCLFLIPKVSNAQPATDSGDIVAYVGGHVWNGSDFTDRTFYVRDGRFITEPARTDTTIQLEGGYVIPPFGDAHTHMLGAGGISLQLGENLFVPNGIFYGLDLTNPYSEIQEIRDEFEKTATIDVAYANGGLTTTGVHPTAAMERRFTDTDEVTLQNLTLQGDAYWFMDTVADVEEKWPDYMSQRPDVVKVYLTYVARGLEKNECYGLCPEVLQVVVNRAHEAGTRVFAHVNTNKDVQFALDAGIDALAHLPSGNDGIGVSDEEFWLEGETIQRAGRDSVTLTPTASLLVEDADPDTLQKEISRQREQLRNLHEAGVRVALGADEWEKTALYEAMYLHEHKFFDNETLLKIWTETTPQAIFPDRKIGRLVQGYEASFLVLAENPLDKFEAVRSIQRGVKQGKTIIDRASSN